MSGIKQLAGQTVWYGASSIAARLINYLLTPYLTLKLSTAQYGEQSILYSFIPFMNVVFTYGMETAFFRFSQKDRDEKVYNTSSISILISTLLFSALLIIFRGAVSKLLQVEPNEEYITIAALIIGVDALSTIAFAKLRNDGRPLKFAFAKIAGILINIASVYFFISICPDIIRKNPSGAIAALYNKDWIVGYILIANLIQTTLTLLILSKEFLGFKWRFDKLLWKEMMTYALPLIIVGFAGMINETFDRIMLEWWAPVSSKLAAKTEVGIYSACYKLSILITLAVQAFRMGAEPFFFKQAASKDAPRTYARVMKFFVITICFMFLFVMLYIDIWKHFIRNPKMWVGLKVVPILLLANMFLGIYYNLSIWYKLSNKTISGAYITIIGAAVTLIINYIFIPIYSYTACAWATFICYGLMMVISYVWGQKNYRIPYARKKLTAYMAIAVIVYFIHHLAVSYYPENWFKYCFGTVLFAIYFFFIMTIEKQEFSKLPYIGRLIKS